MITIIVNKENNLISEIEIKGHANYDVYGKDIVCASVSSILTTTVNGICMLEKKSISYIENPSFKLKVLNNTPTVEKLLQNMFNLFEELEKQYPKNIKIR